MTDYEKDILLTFKYDPETGEVRRIRKLTPWHGYQPVNELVGTDSHGYQVTTFQKKRVFIHRVAWFLKTGKFPPEMMDIDHINGDKKDNRWVNLRLATRGQNNMNSGNSKRNSTGQKGVHFIDDDRCDRTKKWFARITFNRKIIHLGTFETFEDAVQARRDAELKYFGEFMKVRK